MASISEIVLIYYNSELFIIVKIDALDYMLVDIFFQYDSFEVLQLIAFYSKKHNPAECNYEIYNKELIDNVCTFEN